MTTHFNAAPASCELALGPLRQVSANRVEGDVRIGPKTYSLHFESDGCPLAANTEAFLACGLLPWMTVGGHVAGSGKVSRRVLDSLPAVMDIHRCWDPALRPLTFPDLQPIERPRPNGNGVGSFFSGGVDGFFTLLRHQEEITDLIVIHEFEASLADPATRETGMRLIRRAADTLGVRVTEIKSNCAPLFKDFANWNDMGFGLALMAVGHLLAPSLGRVYVASTYSYAHLMPQSPHPLLDPLWSTESLQFVHDAGEVRRLRKVAFIARHDVALQNLRVCWKKAHGGINCGRCHKCLRTMLELKAAGALERAVTFRNPLDPRAVSRMNVSKKDGRVYFLRDILQAMGDRPEDAALRRAIRRALRGPSPARKVCERAGSEVRQWLKGRREKPG